MKYFSIDYLFINYLFIYLFVRHVFNFSCKKLYFLFKYFKM